MSRKSLTAIVLCASILASAFVPAVFAENIPVDVDVSGLFNPENNEIIGDNTGNDNTDDSNTGGNNTGDNTGDGETTYIPEDNENTGNSGNSGNSGSSGHSGGGTASVVGPAEDKDDDKVTVLPTPGQTGNETESSTPVVADVNFSDVDKSDWFYNDVGTLVGMGVINGYPDGTFKPDGSVTRAEFLKLLLSLIAGDNLYTAYENVFEDVDYKEWYSTYIISAIVYGVIDPKDYGTKFSPDQPITRREVAKFVVKALQVESDGFKTPYADTADPNIIALYGLGLMQGTVDPSIGYRFFYPDTEISRAETSAVIHRIYKLSVDGDKYIEQFMKENNLPALVPQK